MPKFTKHLNPARARLRDAIATKAAAVAEVAAVQLRIDRLRSVVDSVEPARAALAAFDSEHSAALATWARVTGSPLPKIDAEKRSVLVSALADVEAQGAAATSAMESLQVEARIAAEKASAAHKAVWVAGKMVLLDEADATLSVLTKAVESAFAAKRRVDAARQSILAELRGDDPDHREILVTLEAFDRARRVAESSPFAPDVNEFRAEWQAFAASLLQSPEAAIGDAPVAPLPAYQHIEMPDAVTAAWAAVQFVPFNSRSEMTLMADKIKKFHELADDDPFVLARQSAPSELTLGNIGRMGAAIDAFGKRADAVLATLDALNARLDALEAEKPPQPKIYRK